ncbi:MAG: ECF transporter S component [Clostridium sp.]|nr:ECF transporter S component [Clostridium sp.]
MSTPLTAEGRSANRNRIVLLVQFAVLLAVEALVCFTPLGSLPIGPLVATLSHIPVIFTAVLFGPLAGAGMGFFFGLFSFLVWTFQAPNPVIAFLFTPAYSAPDAAGGNPLSLLIVFVPRILIGVTAGLSYKALSGIKRKDAAADGEAKAVGLPAKTAAMSAAAVLGTLTNTILVLGGFFLFFHGSLSELGAIPAGQGLVAFIIAQAGWNALLELAAAVVLTAPVCLALQKVRERITL